MVLTNRERKILLYLSDGKTQGEVAETMSLSRDTIKLAIRDVRWKFGAKNTTHAMTMAFRKGMIW